jgi:putative membrane protein
MHRYSRWAFALALLPLAACSSSNPPAMASVTPVAPAAPTLAAQDQSFIATAAGTDAGEIQAANLALQKAPNPRVKTFAQRMIDDHTKTTQQLTSIAQAKGITMPPATPPEMATEQLAKLQTLSGRRFDRDYIHGQVLDHEAAIKAFQTEIAQGQDPELKTFAQTTLPILQQHLHMAQSLARRGV